MVQKPAVLRPSETARLEAVVGTGGDQGASQQMHYADVVADMRSRNVPDFVARLHGDLVASSSKKLRDGKRRI